MQGNRNEGQSNELPDPDSPEYRAQKIVLLELVVTRRRRASTSTSSSGVFRSQATRSSRPSRLSKRSAWRCATATSLVPARRRSTSSTSGR